MRETTREARRARPRVRGDGLRLMGQQNPSLRVGSPEPTTKKKKKKDAGDFVRDEMMNRNYIDER